MCGIAGIVAPEIYDSQVLRETAVSMADSMQHRGPDAQGVFVDSEFRLALSHRRLSIQDLSPTGHQPMSSSSGRFHVVYNGEIYNFKQLSHTLLQRKHQFHGHSDTEVLLAALEEWGIEETLHRICGMFAMAIWDSKDHQLILCRDRMGEKPLFFGWINGCFVFASELKAFQRVFPGSLAISQKSLSTFFRFGYVPTPYSIYKNIYKLLPGSYLRISADPLPASDRFEPLPSKTSFSPQPYWNLADIAHRGISEPITDQREAIDQLDHLLQDVVSQQKIADVPIGSFLSGGIDSSLISAVMQAVSSHPIKTFTIGFNEKEFDEAPYARKIARHIGSDHQEYYISAADGLKIIRDLPQYWDEPFADSSQIPALLVAKMARQKVTVCLTGDGGDELFCGYNRYYNADKLWRQQQKVPFLAKRMTSSLLNSIPTQLWDKWYRFFKHVSMDRRTQANFGLKMHKLAGLLSMKSQHESYRYLLSYWQPQNILPGVGEAASVMDRDPDPGMGNFIHDAMFWDQMGYLVDDNLVKGDRSSMAHSLETRLPLLDHRIVEFSWRLPLTFKYQNGTSKWLLRQVLNRYVPHTLIERPKMGFTVPIGDWLRGPLKNWAGDLIFSRSSHQNVELNSTTIANIWREHNNGSHDHSHKLWSICMWSAWLNKYH